MPLSGVIAIVTGRILFFLTFAFFCSSSFSCSIGDVSFHNLKFKCFRS